jgi:methylmalonyl-CoA carboxyltransferase large subunit
LEAAAGAAGQLAPTPSAEGLSEELLVVISAAIAAFLGKRPHLRQIRVLGSAAWAQQGRATLQASHARPG